MFQVIVVEDEILIREAICSNMQWGELDCELAGSFANGRDALDFVRLNPVDIVLTDIAMPYMDGLELCRLLSMEPKKQEIQKVIFSGYDSFEYAKEAIRYGVKEYLLKPVTRDELVEALIRITKSIDRQKESFREYYTAIQICKENRLYLKSQVLMKFLKGDKSTEQMKEEFLKHEIVLNDSRYYTAGIVRISKCLKRTVKDENLKQFILQNVADEILTGYTAGEAYFGDAGDMVILLVGKEERPLCGELADQILDEIQKELQKVLGTEVGIYLGEQVKGTTLIKKSYRHASELLDQEFIHGAGAAMKWEKVRDTAKTEHRSGQLQQLYLEIKACDKCKIEQLLQDMEQEMCCNLWTKGKVIAVIQEILLNMQMFLNQIQLKEKALYPKIQRAMDDMGETCYIGEAMGQLKELLYEVVELMASRQEKSMNRRAILAIDYIEKNYMKPEISLQSLCDYLAVSPSNFSAVFKEATGGTFVDYLIHTRMEKAKMLLETTDMKNYEIADRVGFSDPHYFSVSFKKAVGRTPKEYAKEMRK